MQSRMCGKKYLRKTGKKLLQILSNLVNVHPPCADSTEKFEIISIYFI